MIGGDRRERESGEGVCLSSREVRSVIVREGW